MTRRPFLPGLLRRLAVLYPREVTPSEGLSRALRFLDAGVSPETLVRGGYGCGAVVAGVVVAVAGFRGWGPLGVVVAVALGLVSVHVVHEAPQVAALARRTRALGRTPDLVARAVLRMRVAPSPERAAAFAAESGDGPLAAGLAAHVDRARAAGGDALASFGAEWGEWYPHLERALGLVSAAGGMDSPDRERTLDRALAAVVDGTRASMRSFAARISRPVTALYAFGVLLPTALVALLPAAAAAGVGITTWTVVVVYDLLLPLAVVAAGVRLVASRPVAFPPPAVDRSHPEVPDRRWPAPAVAGLAAATGWVVADHLLPPWAGPVAAVGVGAGAILWVYCRPVVAVYERVRAVEAGLTDALALIGRRVANGVAVEAAIDAAAGEIEGPMGEVLDRAATRQRQLNVGVTAAFLGDHGALSAVPSPRVRGSMAILGLAAREGEPAGSALLTLADHVEDLHRLEREARHDLSSVCGTLHNTGALFGPMVAGATVALADTLGSGAALPGQALPWLAVAVGGYVLASAVVLPALATSLVRGFDPPLVGHRVGRALLVATPVYLGSYLLVSGIA